MAYLQKQNVSVSFNGGLQQKTDVLQLQPNNMLRVENARFIKSGQVNKRPGFDAITNQISDGTNINAAVAINTFNNELLLFDGSRILSYIEGAEAWINRGTAISVINSSSQVIHTIAAEQVNPDGVYSAGINLYTWEDSRGGVRYSVVDNATGAFAVQDQLIFDYPASYDQTLLRAKTIVDGAGDINIFYTDGGSTLIQNKVAPNRPTILGPSIKVILDGYNTGLVYDVANLEGSIIYAYCSQLGSNLFSSVSLKLPSVKVDVFDTSLVPTSDQVSCVNVLVDSTSNVWVSFAVLSSVISIDIPDVYTATVYTSCFTKTGTVIMPATAIDTIVGTGAAMAYQVPTIATVETNDLGAVYVVYEVSQPAEYGTDPNNYFKVAKVQNNGKFSAEYTQRYLGLASKGWTYNRNQYINVASESTLQSTYFTYCLNRQTPIGKVNSQIGGGYRSNNMLAECSPGATDGAYLCAFGQKGRFQTNNNTSFSLIGVNAETINFNHNNSFNAVEENNNFLFVGGFLQSYDGVSVSEQNFHFFPEDANVAVDGYNSGELSAGFYQYQITYEWTDNHNQTQYSAPSLAIQTSLTVAEGNAVDIEVPTLRVTAKENLRTPVTINFYRTQANLGVFYKVGSITNDPTVDSLVFIDTQSDQAIGANMPGYWQSQVANTSPPACSLITYYQNRVMLSGLEDPNVIWFSQSVADFSQYNSVAPEFSNLLTVGVDAWHGDITAIGWMDDKLLIFKDQTIYYMNGDGPTASGTGDQFPAPTSILSTVGSTDQNSLVVTYNGVFFKSSKGIYMVDRGLNPSYIGAPVEDFNSLTITGAELLADTDEVVFSSAEGTLLVYNYYFSLWSTWSGLPSIDSVVWQDQLVLVNKDGLVLVQDNTGTVWTDNGAPISLSLQTPWITVAGMQGYQSVFRCFMLGGFRGSHLMNVAVATNYNPSPVQTDIINGNIVSAANWGGQPLWGSPGPWGGTFVPYQFQVNMNALSVRNQAIQLTFFDSPNSGYTEGYTLSSLTFEIGVANDGMRLPLSQKVG